MCGTYFPTVCCYPANLASTFPPPLYCTAGHLRAAGSTGTICDGVCLNDSAVPVSKGHEHRRECGFGELDVGPPFFLPF